MIHITIMNIPKLIKAVEKPDIQQRCVVNIVSIRFGRSLFKTPSRHQMPKHNSCNFVIEDMWVMVNEYEILFELTLDYVNMIPSTLSFHGYLYSF